MKKLNKLIILFVAIINGIVADGGPATQKTLNENNLSFPRTAHISPEIKNELKDFENLISKATVDEIVAEHYVIDKSFRTALKYFRSYEFSQMQKKLLDVPEIIDILEFLHLTTGNATTGHMGATKRATTIAKVKASLDEYNVDDVTSSDNRVDKTTANTGTIINPQRRAAAVTTENAKEAISMKKIAERPHQQFNKKGSSHVGDANDDDGMANENANSKSFSILSNNEQTSVRIVLLDDLEVKAKIHNRGQNSNNNNNIKSKHHYRHHSNNHYHGSLGTFTSFVDEVLQHLPHSAFQNMIRDKCKKNSKFAEFYQALRSSEFKSIIEQAKTTNNIAKIIQTLGSHDVDVNSLEPIAFKVISWGPDV